MDEATHALLQAAIREMHEQSGGIAALIGVLEHTAKRQQFIQALQIEERSQFTAGVTQVNCPQATSNSYLLHTVVAAYDITGGTLQYKLTIGNNIWRFLGNGNGLMTLHDLKVTVRPGDIRKLECTNGTPTILDLYLYGDDSMLRGTL